MHKLRHVLLISTGAVLIILAVFFRTSPPSPLYFVKIIRETFQSFFIFGSEDRTSWLLTLSDKRLSEAEKLENKNMDFFARTQLERGKNYQIQAEALLLTLKDKTNTTYLEDKLKKNKEKLEMLMISLSKS